MLTIIRCSVRSLLFPILPRHALHILRRDNEVATLSSDVDLGSKTVQVLPMYKIRTHIPETFREHTGYSPAALHRRWWELLSMLTNCSSTRDQDTALPERDDPKHPKRLRREGPGC